MQSLSPPPWHSIFRRTNPRKSPLFLPTLFQIETHYNQTVLGRRLIIFLQMHVLCLVHPYKFQHSPSPLSGTSFLSQRSISKRFKLTKKKSNDFKQKVQKEPHLICTSWLRLFDMVNDHSVWIITDGNLQLRIIML